MGVTIPIGGSISYGLAYLPDGDATTRLSREPLRD